MFTVKVTVAELEGRVHWTWITIIHLWLQVAPAHVGVHYDNQIHQGIIQFEQVQTQSPNLPTT